MRTQKSSNFNLTQRINQAIAEARTITTQLGLSSPEAAVAWDIVEELDAEAAHQRMTNEAEPDKMLGYWN